MKLLEVRSGKVQVYLGEAQDFIKEGRTSMDLQRCIADAVEEMKKDTERLHFYIYDMLGDGYRFREYLIAQLGIDKVMYLESEERALQRFDENKKEIYIYDYLTIKSYWNKQHIDEIKYVVDGFAKLGYKIIITTTVHLDEFFKNIKQIEEGCKIFKQTGCVVEISICEQTKGQSKKAPIAYNYTKEQLKTFKEFAKNNNVSLAFTDDIMWEDWTFEEIIKTNNEIDKIVNFIKEKGFTPYEAMLYIHDTLATRFIYNKVNLVTDRSIVGPFNTDGIVCAGFALITKAIIDKLNMPTLKCDLYSSVAFDEDGNKIAGHAQCLIRIRDKAYKINGIYLNDITKDAKDKFNLDLKSSLALSLYPLSDVNYLKDVAVKTDSIDRYEQSFITNIKPCFKKFKKVKVIREIHYKLDPKLPTAFKTYPYSRPIPIQTFVKGMYNVVKELPDVQSDEHAIEIVKEKLHNSIKKAKDMFKDNAQNVFLNCENVQEVLSVILDKKYTR